MAKNQVSIRLQPDDLEALKKSLDDHNTHALGEPGVNDGNETLSGRARTLLRLALQGDLVQQIEALKKAAEDEDQDQFFKTPWMRFVKRHLEGKNKELVEKNKTIETQKADLKRANQARSKQERRLEEKDREFKDHQAQSRLVIGCLLAVSSVLALAVVYLLSS